MAPPYKCAGENRTADQSGTESRDWLRWGSLRCGEGFFQSTRSGIFEKCLYGFLDFNPLLPGSWLRFFEFGRDRCGRNGLCRSRIRVLFKFPNQLLGLFPASRLGATADELASIGRALDPLGTLASAVVRILALTRRVVACL